MSHGSEKPQLLTWAWVSLTLGTLLLALGAWDGLWVAPEDRLMGNVYRIIYVHVPAAWIALVAYTITFGASVCYLLKPNLAYDDCAVSSAKIGMLFNFILIATGSLWARPTWGVFWSWDPRLTSVAIMFFAFAGYLALRNSIADSTRRATWASVVAILAWVDIPIVYLSVKWWNSLHQIQSSPETVAHPMVLALRINAFSFLFLYFGFLLLRTEITRRERAAFDVEPPEAPR